MCETKTRFLKRWVGGCGLGKGLGIEKNFVRRDFILVKDV